MSKDLLQVQESKEEILSPKTTLFVCDLDNTLFDFELCRSSKLLYFNGSNIVNDPEPVKEQISKASQMVMAAGYEFFLIFLSCKPFFDVLCEAAIKHYSKYLYDIHPNGKKKPIDPKNTHYRWRYYLPGEEKVINNDGKTRNYVNMEGGWQNNKEIDSSIIPSLHVAVTNNGHGRPKAVCMQHIIEQFQKFNIFVTANLTFLVDDQSAYHARMAEKVFGEKRFNFISAEIIADLAGSVENISQRTQATLEVFTMARMKIKEKIDMEITIDNATRFLEEEKYNLMMLELSPIVSPSQRAAALPEATCLLLAIAALAQGSIHWKIKKLDNATGSILQRELFELYHAIDTINEFMRTTTKLFELFERFCDVNGREQIKQSIHKHIFDRLKTDIIPHLEIKSSLPHPQKVIIFNEYPPSTCIFSKIYLNSRNTEGFFSRLFRAEEDKEMDLRLQSFARLTSLTFKEVLDYGVKHPNSRTARILEKYFKTYLDEIKDKPLKDYFSQENNLLSELLPKTDGPEIVKDYLFSR